MNCGCTDPCQPNSIPCTCEARVTSDCVTVSGATSNCLAIDDNLLLTDYLTQMDERICEKVDSVTNFIALENVGTGSELYKGDSLLGKKQIRSLISIDANLVVTQTADEIQLDLNIPAITPPDGTETKLVSGTNTTVTGLGTTASPYIVNSTDTIANGSETKINAGTNVTVSGNGTTATPYIINSSGGAAGDSVFEKVNEGNGVGIIVKDRVATNYGNVGFNAIDLSRSTSVSSVVGATGADSFAVGINVTASSGDSIAMGGGFNESVSAKATGNGSIALGRGARASGLGAVAIGGDSAQQTISSGSNSLALKGGEATGSGTVAISCGGTARSSGNFSLVIGSGESSGQSAFSIGISNVSKSYQETVLGSFNNSTDTPLSTTTWNPLDKLLSVGNGTNGTNLSDALVILKNGLGTLPSVTNTLITSASGKAIVTKEYLEASNNLQRVITTSTVILDIDNNNTIFINNGATPITITINSSITIPNFGVGFIQEGTGDVTFVGTGVSLTNPIGLKSKGQGYATFIERKLNTTSFFLLGDTKP